MRGPCKICNCSVHILVNRPVSRRRSNSMVRQQTEHTTYRKQSYHHIRSTLYHTYAARRSNMRVYTTAGAQNQPVSSYSLMVASIEAIARHPVAVLVKQARFKHKAIFTHNSFTTTPSPVRHPQQQLAAPQPRGPAAPPAAPPSCPCQEAPGLAAACPAAAWG